MTGVGAGIGLGIVKLFAEHGANIVIADINTEAAEENTKGINGLPQLNNTLRLSANEPLKQRITMNFNIESLTRDETFSYIRAKLAGAKSTMDIFSPNALEAISNASNGIPRIINKICNCALMIAASKGLDFIDSDIIILAVNDMELA